VISVNENIFVYENIFKRKYNLSILLKEKNNLQNNFPVINVVGTNGKGSVSNYLSHGLKNKFEKVGLFISPAFLYHNERIQINNVPISDAELTRIIEDSKDEIKKYELSFFEIWTYIAIKYFSENKIDIAVIEAGIGGRLDSTKVFANQIAVAITSIGFDHTEILGDTVDEIIFQKCGIANPGTKVFIANDNLKYKNIFENNLKENIFEFAKTSNEVSGYQKINLGLAKRILDELQIENKNLFLTKPMNGRFTTLCENPKIIIDGCHNEDGISKMISNAKELNEDFTILFATSNKKDGARMTKQLQQHFEKVFVTSFDHVKSWEVPNELQEIEVKDWKKFVEETKDNLIVCGSLYFIPQVYELIKGR
jgi:dihydrofolate synthase/folylpolyglutamate synthase